MTRHTIRGHRVDHREDGSSSGEDPDADAEPATSIEEEVADLWRLQDGGEHGDREHGDGEHGDPAPSDGGDEAQADDDPPGADDEAGEDTDRDGSSDDEH
jgi:hypothetical protein